MNNAVLDEKLVTFAYKHYSSFHTDGLEFIEFREKVRIERYDKSVRIKLDGGFGSGFTTIVPYRSNDYKQLVLESWS